MSQTTTQCYHLVVGHDFDVRLFRLVGSFSSSRPVQHEIFTRTLLTGNGVTHRALLPVARDDQRTIARAAGHISLGRLRNNIGSNDNAGLCDIACFFYYYYFFIFFVCLFVVVFCWKEGNVLFNDALNTFYLRLYGVGQW